MRIQAVLSLVVALALVAMPQALARPDAEGDERLSIPTVPLVDGLLDCSAPAADLVRAWAYSDGVTLWAGLTIADMDDRTVTCAPAGVVASTEGESGTYHIRLLTPARETENPLVSEPPIEVSFGARLTEEGVEACTAVSGPSGKRTPCIAGVAREGSNLTWTLPLVFTYHEEDFVHDIDLRGLAMHGGASARVALPTGALGATDWVDLDAMTL